MALHEKRRAKQNYTLTNTSNLSAHKKRFTKTWCPFFIFNMWKREKFCIGWLSNQGEHQNYISTAIKIKDDFHRNTFEKWRQISDNISRYWKPEQFSFLYLYLNLTVRFQNWRLTFAHECWQNADVKWWLAFPSAKKCGQSPQKTYWIFLIVFVYQQ